MPGIPAAAASSTRTCDDGPADSDTNADACSTNCVLGGGSGEGGGCGCVVSYTGLPIDYRDLAALAVMFGLALLVRRRRRPDKVRSAPPPNVNRRDGHRFGRGTCERAGSRPRSKARLDPAKRATPAAGWPAPRCGVSCPCCSRCSVIYHTSAK